MKRFLNFLLLTPVICFAQAPQTRQLKPASLPKIQNANSISMPFREGKIFYEFVDSSVKMSKEQIYNAAKIWFANAFVSSQFVLQAQIPESGELVGKGTYFYSTIYGGVTFKEISQFTIKISCRNNKFRIQIYDIGNKPEGTEEIFHSLEEYYIAKNDGPNAGILRAVDEKMTDLIFSAKKQIPQKDDF